MTRRMRMAGDAAGIVAPGTAARRTWASTAWLVAGTIVVSVTSYSLSLRVASERREVERLERGNEALASKLKAMDGELRVRMRLPQLQRWNDRVLGLVPISATQFLDSPVRLANYGKALEGETPLPRPQLAVRDLAPAAPRAVQPQLVSAPQAIRPEPSRPVVVQTVSRPAEAATDELVRQVEMTLAAPPGPNP